MREDVEVCDFTAGELSPKLKGRTDYARYFDGLASQLNMVSMPQGGATRRPGFAFVNESLFPLAIPPSLSGPTINAMGSVTPNGTGMVFDWANRALYAIEIGQTGLVKYNMNNGAVLASVTLAQQGLAAAGPDSSGNIFCPDTVGSTVAMIKYSPALVQIGTFGHDAGSFTDPTTEYPSPSSNNIVCLKSDANYLVSGYAANVYALNTDTMAFAGLAQVLVAGAPSIGCAGPQSPASATAYFMTTSDLSLVYITSVTFKAGAGAYDVTSWPTANAYIAVAAVGTILPTAVDPGWSAFTELAAILYDQTDGNLIIVAQGTGGSHQRYLVKIKSSNASVLWAVPVVQAGRGNGSSQNNTRIQFGVLAYYDTDGNVYIINTIAGTLTSTIAIPGLTVGGDLASDDASGDIFVYGNYNAATTGAPTRVNGSGNYGGLWGRLDLANQASVGLTRAGGPLRQSRLRRFIFSTIQAYMLEFTAGLVLVYANDGVALNGGNPIEIATPWGFADLPLLEFTQSADTLYIYHPLYAPRTLTRDASNNWTLAKVGGRDGPYLDVNGTTTTLSPSGVSGNITITASSVVGINITPTSTGLGFQASDLGRMIRIRLFSLWAWCLVTAVTDSLHVKATVQPWIQNGGAYGAIDGQAWAANTLYPTGAVVLINDNGTNRYYIAITGGISGTTNGPSGTGSNLLDGTVTWSLAGPFDAIAWRQYTVYAPGDIIYSTPPSGSGLFYQCTTGGNTGGSSVPPVGTGTNISAADQNCLWESIATFVFPTTTTFWQLGKWYGPDGVSTSNWPQIPLFYQGRLMSMSTNAQPGAVEGSYSNDFTNMAPTRADGTVTAANAVSEVIASDEVDDVRWSIGAGSSVAQQLAIGTSGGEWIMQPATNSQAWGPGNNQVYQETKFGGALGVQPLRIGKSILFADVAGRVLYDWIWQWAINGFLGIDRSVDAEHMTRCDPPTLQGIVAMAYQQKPYKLLWMAKGDGTLVAMTYMPDEKVIAWHRHQLGGTYNSGAPFIESIDAIPSPDTTYDELWAVVRRSDPNGNLIRTVEVMTRFFDALPQDQATFVDCAFTSALTNNGGTLSYTALSGTGVNVHNGAGGFSGGQVSAILRVNGGIAIMRAYVDANDATFDWIIPATRTAPLGTTAWSFNFPETTFGGLNLLAGQSVQILGDGADYGVQTVASNGAIALPTPGASYAVIGLPMPWELETMPFAPSRAVPVPATGKTKKFDKLYLRFYQSLGCLFGQRYTDSMTGAVIDKTEALLSQSSSSSLGWAPQYVSEIRRLTPPSGFDQEGQVLVKGQGPFPVTVLSIGVSADVGGS